MQAGYFLNLNPDIITSCCGKQFGGDAAGIASDISMLATKWVMAGFYCVVAGTIAVGTVFYLKAKWGYIFSTASLFTLLLSISAIISFISAYFYELPTHHCPFCILQAEYRYIGYPIYISLFGGALSDMGVAILMPFKHLESLRDTLPLHQRRLTLLSLVFYLAFILIVAYGMLSSNLKV